MKTQVFLDGNKRAAVIYANHYLIAHGQGMLVIPELVVPDFKKLLVSFYEGEDPAVISAFLKNKFRLTLLRLPLATRRGGTSFLPFFCERQYKIIKEECF